MAGYHLKALKRSRGKVFGFEMYQKSKRRIFTLSKCGDINKIELFLWFLVKNENISKAMLEHPARSSLDVIERKEI